VFVGILTGNPAVIKTNAGSRPKKAFLRMADLIWLRLSWNDGQKGVSHIVFFSDIDGLDFWRQLWE
jgi:hypothetical protein